MTKFSGRIGIVQNGNSVDDNGWGLPSLSLPNYGNLFFGSSQNSVDMLPHSSNVGGSWRASSQTVGPASSFVAPTDDSAYQQMTETQERSVNTASVTGNRNRWGFDVSSLGEQAKAEAGKLASWAGVANQERIAPSSSAPEVPAIEVEKVLSFLGRECFLNALSVCTFLTMCLNLIACDCK